MEPDLDAATLKAWARAIDDGPFSSLCWGERVAFDNPEWLKLLGALAAWGDRVRLVTTVIVPQLHDPVMLAKKLATSDMLSAGRLTVHVDKANELFDVARAAWADAGKRTPHLATSFWFAIGEDPRAQIHRHLRRYMNWVPGGVVDAMAPTTGWAGSEDELLVVLREFDGINTDEIYLIPTSADVDQVRRVAEVVKDFTSAVR